MKTNNDDPGSVARSRAGRPRSYRQTRRAEAQARTRQRIVEAIVALHQEVGPARTTVSAIAERAGVERLTVYRHFPSELAQFIACSAHWSNCHPAPDPARWSAIADPRQRVRAGLADLYRFYAEGEPMLAMIMRDLESLPELQRVAAPFLQYLDDAAQLLAAPWPGPPDRALFAAAARHALHFSTWRSLIRGQGLAHGQAVELMARLIAAAAQPS
jgi:AcrR family transcriptional regulator